MSLKDFRESPDILSCGDLNLQLNSKLFQNLRILYESQIPMSIKFIPLYNILLCDTPFNLHTKDIKISLSSTDLHQIPPDLNLIDSKQI